MANFRMYFDSPKALFFRHISVTFRLMVVALSYCVATATIFAQISLLSVMKAAFYSFFAPAFMVFRLFINALYSYC